MVDPKRLVDRFGSGFERELLLSGSDEQPTPEARERARARVLELALAASAASVGAGVAGAGGAGGKLSSGLTLLFVKWIGAGVVLGTAATWVGTELTAPKHQPPSGQSVAAVAAPAGVSARPRASAAPATTAPEVTVEGVVRPPAPSRSLGDVRIGTAATLMEAESMRRIRAEARNDRARALRMLDEHLLRFPSGDSRGEARDLQEKLRSPRK